MPGGVSSGNDVAGGSILYPKKNILKKTCNSTSIDPKQFFKHRVRKRRPSLVSQNEDIKETDQRACNIYTAGCTMLRTNILHDATALPHSRPRVGKVQRQGQGFSRLMADKRQGGHMADKVWRRSQSGHNAGHKADTGRDMADTGQDMADKVWKRR